MWLQLSQQTKNRRDLSNLIKVTIKPALTCIIFMVNSWTLPPLLSPLLLTLSWIEKQGDHHFRWEIRDFPGGPVVKNPPSNAGYVDSISGLGTKIPHAAGQLSPCVQLQSMQATTREKPVCPNEKILHAAAKIPCN